MARNDEQAHGGAAHVLLVELGDEAGVGAGAVVLAVADNHAAVEAQFAGATCRHSEIPVRPAQSSTSTKNDSRKSTLPLAVFTGWEKGCLTRYRVSE